MRDRRITAPKREREIRHIYFWYRMQKQMGLLVAQCIKLLYYNHPTSSLEVDGSIKLPTLGATGRQV